MTLQELGQIAVWAIGTGAVSVAAAYGSNKLLNRGTQPFFANSKAKIVGGAIVPTLAGVVVGLYNAIPNQNSCKFRPNELSCYSVMESKDDGEYKQDENGEVREYKLNKNESDDNKDVYDKQAMNMLILTLGDNLKLSHGIACNNSLKACKPYFGKIEELVSKPNPTTLPNNLVGQ